MRRSRSLFNTHRAGSAFPIDDCPAAYSGASWYRTGHLAIVNGPGETNDSLTELQEMPRNWKSEGSIVREAGSMHELRRDRDGRDGRGEGISHST